MYKFAYDHRRLSAFLLAFLLAFSFCSNCLAVAVAAVPIAVGAAVVVSSILVAAGLERTGEGFNQLVDSIVTTVREELPTAFTAAGLMLGSLVEGKSLFPKSVIQSVLNAAGDAGAFSSGSFSVDPSFNSALSIFSSPILYEESPSSIHVSDYSLVMQQNDSPVYCFYFEGSDGKRNFYFFSSGAFVLYSNQSSRFIELDSKACYYSASNPNTFTSDLDYSLVDLPLNYSSQTGAYINFQAMAGRICWSLLYGASSSGGVAGVSSSGAYEADKPIDEQLNDTITGWLENEQTLSISGADVQSLPVSVTDSLTGAAEQDQTAAQAGAISSATAAAGVAAADQATQEAEYEDQLTVFEGIRDFAQDKIFPAISPILNKFPFSIPYDFYLMVSALGGTVPNGLSGVADLDPSGVEVAPVGVSALADDDYIYTGSIDFGVGDPVQIELDFSPWLGTFGTIKIMIGFLFTALLLYWVSRKGD